MLYCYLYVCSVLCFGCQLSTLSYFRVNPDNLADFCLDVKTAYDGYSVSWTKTDQLFSPAERSITVFIFLIQKNLFWVKVSHTKKRNRKQWNSSVLRDLVLLVAAKCVRPCLCLSCTPSKESPAKGSSEKRDVAAGQQRKSSRERWKAMSTHPAKKCYPTVLLQRKTLA